MMPLSPEEELKALDRRLVRVSIIDAPGVIAMAIGLFARFSDDPGSLHPVLEDPTVSTGLIVVGGAIMAWAAIQMISIARQRSAVQKRLDS